MAKRRDILKELRAAPAVLSNINPPVDRLLREATDEIERLRTVLKGISRGADDYLQFCTHPRTARAALENAQS